ncbi:MAG TPA: PTS sugar transporter subunit IIA, partial [Syntrophales bacterium]|nr:PTS sugar transporter subunit IIA [Syntrophales bacterium]HQG84360.1 PTS sugar transporter subunit IIA [Syntrophales bacterium]
MQITDLFNRDYIIEELNSVSKRAVLAELSEVLSRDHRGLAPGAMVNVLLEREKLGSTGIGDGIA